jgi:uncharacterized protein
LGRIFVLRLEQDDPLPKSIEDFTAEKQTRLGQVVFISGIYQGKLVAGPRKTAETQQPDPIVLPISEANESIATGVIAAAS